MMFDPGSAVTTLIYGTGTGLGLAAGLQFCKWLLTFSAGRFDARTAHLDKATRELIDQLQTQVKGLLSHQEHVEQKLRNCEERDIEKERRIAHLEGLQLGMGDARQHAQLIIADEKRRGKKDD